MPLPSRRSIRLPGFDYSTPGSYFLTACTAHKNHLFGSIQNGVVLLNSLGQAVEHVWNELPALYPAIVVDQMVVMPNHFHGIVVIHEVPSQRPTLSMVVRAFKSRAARRVNQERGAPGAAVWQRGFYERVIRDGDMLNNVREYIRANPLRWSLRGSGTSAGRGPASMRDIGIAGGSGTRPYG